MMHSDNIANTPITELSLKEDIEKRFLEMYTDASDNAQKRISDSRYFRKFFNGDQYNTERPDMSWLGVLRQKNNSHIPRMAGEETFEALFDILPILLKSKPGIAIEAESNPFTREESMEDSLIAEMMTDIYDNLYRIRSQHIFDSNVVLESLISGAAYVTFQKTHDHRGITVQPRLLLPEQFLGDPDGMCAYNFSDYEYIILTTYRTAFEIYQDYGIEEDEYGQGSSIPGKSFGFLGLQMPSRRESRRSGPVDGRYPVHTLFVRPYTPGIDVSLDADEQPKIQKMTFINESYYVEGSRQDNPYWHGGTSL